MDRHQIGMAAVKVLFTCSTTPGKSAAAPGIQDRMRVKSRHRNALGHRDGAARSGGRTTCRPHNGATLFTVTIATRAAHAASSSVAVAVTCNMEDPH